MSNQVPAPPAAQAVPAPAAAAENAAAIVPAGPTTTTKKTEAALKRQKANDDIRRLIQGSENRDQIMNPTTIPPPREQHHHDTIIGRLDYDKIVLTPLNLNPGLESPYMFLSRYDYLQEVGFFMRDGGGAQWDEDRFGHASPGFLFAFVQYQPAKGVDTMEIFEVVGKYGASHRRRHWNIPEQGKRKVLRLSQFVGSARYSDYAKAMGYNALSGGRFGAVKGTVVRRWPKDIDVDIAV